MTDLEKIARMVEEIAKADGCNGCTFEDVQDWELPCSKCKRNCKDYYRVKAVSDNVTQD